MPCQSQGCYLQTAALNVQDVSIAEGRLTTYRIKVADKCILKQFSGLCWSSVSTATMDAVDPAIKRKEFQKPVSQSAC